jgi:hypothetical protein
LAIGQLLGPWDWEEGRRGLVAPTKIRRLIVALELLKSNKNVAEQHKCSRKYLSGIAGIVGVTWYAGGMLVYRIY